MAEPKTSEAITVKIAGSIRTERTEHQAEWELRESQDRSANDDRVFYVALASAAFALIQAGLFWWQLKLMQRTIGQTDEALTHARQEFKASQRAWVKFEFSLASSNPEAPTSKSPLLIDQSGLYLWLKVKLKNSGNAPALSVDTVVHCYAPTHHGPRPTQVQREYCEQVKDPKSYAQDAGSVLFPGEEVEFISRTNLPRSELDAAVANNLINSRSDSPVKVFPLFLVGCVDYRSAIDGSHHQTGFVFQVSATQADNGKMQLVGLMPLAEDQVPLEHFVLAPWYDTGAFFAD